ncbi:MAG: carbohydrate deacetylase [Candidatus Levyibacteriota bacterium]
MKKLIINADDFGMSKEVNEGTKEGIRQGIITSVSVMANMPYFDDAIRFLKKHPQISVGLHFNITEGKSLLIPKDAKNLIREDDYFYHWPHMIGRVATKNIKPTEIEQELKKQYTALKKTGLPITHIDSHHHIHLYPSIFKIVSAFADREKIQSLRGNYFNSWNLTLGVWKKPIVTQVIVNSALLLSNLKHGNHKHLYEINRFYDINWGKDLSNKELLVILNNLPQGTTEFICHLAIESATGNKTFLTPRYKVLKLLTDPQVKKHLTMNGIFLTAHKALLEKDFKAKKVKVQIQKQLSI